MKQIIENTKIQTARNNIKTTVLKSNERKTNGYTNWTYAHTSNTAKKPAAKSGDKSGTKT